MLSLLRLRLHHTIGLWLTGAATEVKPGFAVGSEGAAHGLTVRAIPFKRVGNVTSIVYACAIAHQLASKPLHAAAIAAQLVHALQQDLASHPEPFLQGMTLEATAAGFIQVEIGDRAIAAWLDLLLANALPQPPMPTLPMSERERQLMLHAAILFEVQHAHARCCSLLYLAHQEALISLEQLEKPPCYWRFSSPVTLPWLTSTDQLCLQHSTDRTLLGQLFEAHDQLFDVSRRQTPASVLRSAQVVAQAFQSFHRAHPLWDGAREESVLTVARLGLLMITQRVLYLLLRDGLDLCPVANL